MPTEKDCLACTDKNPDCQNCDAVKENVQEKNKRRCGQVCEVYSRVCGYHRPVRNWNIGKQEEFRLRKSYRVKALT